MDTTIEFSSIKSKELLNNGSSSARLILITTLPSSSTPCPLCSFYQDVSTLCKKFCQKKLLPTVLQKSEDESIPIEWLYRLTVLPSIISDGISVTLSVCLTDKTRRRTIDRLSLTHLWDSNGNKIISKSLNKDHKEGLV